MILLALARLRRLARQVALGLLAAAVLNAPASYLNVAAEQEHVPVPTPAVLSESAVLAAYCSEAAEIAGATVPWAGKAPSATAATTLALEDRWLTEDPYRYNHGLARACAVLAAVCNSESRFYSTPDGSPFAEGALGALGFSDVHTGSYALRSRVLDELGALLTGQHAVAAYTLAHKEVPGDHGAETVILMGIRGSYGTEWLSNFDLGEEGDHRGFEQAEQEALEALRLYARSIGAQPDRTRVLLCGHSRGGAVANLLAADLNRLSATPEALTGPSAVYAYTFAAPACTRSPERDDSLHGNVFNVVDAEDVVPRWPLEGWGFGRYGVTVQLPCAEGLGPVTARALAAAMERNAGTALTMGQGRCNRDALDALEEALEPLGPGLPLPDLAAPARALGAVLQLDPLAALVAHLPDAYIAKLQCLEPQQLAFER